MNSEELKDKYKHFSIRNFPFQDTIIDAIPEKEFHIVTEKYGLSISIFLHQKVTIFK